MQFNRLYCLQSIPKYVDARKNKLRGPGALGEMTKAAHSPAPRSKTAHVDVQNGPQIGQKRTT